MDCTCCGEPTVQGPPEGEWSCACEWDGCDEDCPIVGHLYREDERARQADIGANLPTGYVDTLGGR